VLVVDWRQPVLTRRCLASLVGPVAALGAEIVLAVNEADAPTLEAYRRDLPTVTVVGRPDNAGFAGGVAAAAAASSGEVLVLVNNDAVVEPTFLVEGLAALERTSAAAVAATVVLEGSFVEDRTGRDGADLLVGLDGRRWRRVDSGGVRLLNGTGVDVTVDGNGHDRDWLAPLDAASRRSGDDRPFGFSGGAAFLRRSAVEAVGGLDESFFMYYEDVDLAWRLRLAGHEVAWAPDAVVVHRHAASSGSSGPLVRYQSMRNRLATVLRNGSAPLVRRVVLRTVLRCARDVLPRGGGAAQLSRRQWLALGLELPGLWRRARRARSADGVAEVDRRSVERLLVPPPGRGKAS